MSIRLMAGSLAVVVSMSAWSAPSSAETPARLHLGLDTSFVRSTTTETTATMSTGYASTTSTKFVSNSTEWGLPGQPVLSLGVLLGSNVDLGARFAYTTGSEKSGVESSATEVETSAYLFDPYIGYLAGSRGDRARFALGLTAGLGSGTRKTTSPSTSTNTSETTVTSDSTVSSTQYGAFMGLRAFATDQISIDPIVLLLSTSSKTKVYVDSDTPVDVSYSGLSFMLNVGVSLWLGGGPPPEALAPTGTASTQLPSVHASPVAVTPQSSQLSDRVTLPIQEGRAVTLITSGAPGDQGVKIVLRESLENSNLAACKQIVLHVPDQDDVTLAVTVGKLTTVVGSIPVLKGDVPRENLKAFVRTPIVSEVTAPDHWISVCGARWYLRDDSREMLKNYLRSLPSPPAAAEASEPAEATPEPAEATPEPEPAAATPEPAPAPARVPSPVRN